jgi:hypothetical protein
MESQTDSVENDEQFRMRILEAQADFMKNIPIEPAVVGRYVNQEQWGSKRRIYQLGRTVNGKSKILYAA